MEQEYWGKWNIFEASYSDETRVKVVFKDGSVFTGIPIYMEERSVSETGKEELGLAGENDTYCTFSLEDVESVEAA